MKSVNQPMITRRALCLQTVCALAALGTLSLSGCSIFKGKTQEKDVDEFEEFAEEEDSVFESERKKLSETSEFVAQNGRKSKSKKTAVRPGDDFLLSDKAKEIYANTER